VSGVRRGGIAASAFLVLIAVALAAFGGGGGSEGEATGGPKLVGQDELADLAAALEHDVFWAGSLPSRNLEVTEEAGGSVYVRYLPGGAQAGDRAARLTVGTYPLVDAEAATRRAAAKAGAPVRKVPEGAIAFVGSGGTSVYVAFPESDLQVEVYDPRPGRALALVEAGEIRPVGE
jgi:hypothetical protein